MFYLLHGEHTYVVIPQSTVHASKLLICRQQRTTDIGTVPQLAGQSKHSLFQWSCSLQKLSSCPIIAKHEVASHLGNKVGKWNTHSCKPSLHPHIFALLPFNCADKSPGSGHQGSLLHMGVLRHISMQAQLHQ